MAFSGCSFFDFYKDLNEKERSEMISNASEAFARFLESLCIDWKNNPNTCETPDRVARMYVSELLAGRFTARPEMKKFALDAPSNDAFNVVGPISIKSICAHHCMPFSGHAMIGMYSSSKCDNNHVYGLSKYARLCDWYAKRGQLQENLNRVILNALVALHPGYDLAVFIRSKHKCNTHRGINQSSNSFYTLSSTDGFHEREGEFLMMCTEVTKDIG